MTVLLALLSLLPVALCLYLAVLTVAAFVFRKRTAGQAQPLGLAVVIPAHDESLQIRETIGAVNRSRYPADRYRAVVIADNCQDDTAAVAREAGATVLERSDPDRRGKGQALDWFLREQQEAYAAFEAIVIIDADTLVDENFLEEVSASLSHPDVLAVQGFYGVANEAENWRTALMSAALAVFHHVRPAGRNRLGGSAGLKGNGMAFRADLLRRYGWPAHSVVEDLEFGTRMLLDGILVHYNPDAIARAEMAVSREQAETQRRRWEGGRYEMLRRYAPTLLRRWIAERRFRYFDGFMDLLLPPLAALVLSIGLLLAAALWWAPRLSPFLALALFIVGIYVAAGLILRKVPPSVWRHLILAPLFILWKIPLYFKLLGGGGGGDWVRTKRKSEMVKKD